MTNAFLQAVAFVEPGLLSLFPLALLLRKGAFRLGDRRFASRQRYILPLSFGVFEIDRLFQALLRQGQFVPFFLQGAAAQLQFAV